MCPVYIWCVWIFSFPDEKLKEIKIFLIKEGGNGADGQSCSNVELAKKKKKNSIAVQLVR